MSESQVRKIFPDSPTEGKEPAAEKNPDVPEWRKMLKASTLKKEHIENCEQAELLLPELPLIKGQLTYWYGFPSCGKTAAATQLASLAAGAGYEVHYFQVDVSAADLKVYHQIADREGFTLHSTIAEGITPGSLQKTIFEMATKGTSDELRNMVIILDTFKKFASGGDVNNKRGNVTVFAYLRQLTTKGATVLILGHATKDKNEDGLPRFAGTQEVEDETDSLVCLDHAKSADGSEIKVNAIVKKARSMYDQDWGFTVKRGETLAGNQVEFGPPFDTEIQRSRLRAGIRERSLELVNMICEVIHKEPGINQSKIIEHVRADYANKKLTVPGEKRIRTLLRDLDGDEWISETDPAVNNSKRFRLNDEYQPPAKVQSDQSDQTDQSNQTGESHSS